MKKIIEIPEDIANYLQRLAYETDARSNLCAFMMRQGIKNDAFDDTIKSILNFIPSMNQQKSKWKMIILNPQLKVIILLGALISKQVR